MGFSDGFYSTFSRLFYLRSRPEAPELGQPETTIIELADLSEIMEADHTGAADAAIATSNPGARAPLAMGLRSVISGAP